MFYLSISINLLIKLWGIEEVPIFFVAVVLTRNMAQKHGNIYYDSAS